MKIAELFALRSRVWATRDGCLTHFPKRCPQECPNAGKHDAGLAPGLCECGRCRTC